MSQYIALAFVVRTYLSRQLDTDRGAFPEFHTQRTYDRVGVLFQSAHFEASIDTEITRS